MTDTQLLEKLDQRLQEGHFLNCIYHLAYGNDDIRKLNLMMCAIAELQNELADEIKSFINRIKLYWNGEIDFKEFSLDITTYYDGYVSYSFYDIYIDVYLSFVYDNKDLPHAKMFLLTFGNNWRFDKNWRTSTVLSLARQMYESKDFSPMLILADGLQDAGCDEHWLTYLRDQENKFFRGCWILDQILQNN